MCKGVFFLENEMKLEIKSRSCNESFARVAVAAFVTELNPTIEEISDIKTAVSEAVTNSIIHGYEGKDGIINIKCKTYEKTVEIQIIDYGKGIENIEPMTHALDDFEVVLREDEAEESVDIEELLQNCDKTDGCEIELPKVVQ